MLGGWDSHSWFWQANKAAMAEHFGVTTKDLRREWDAAEQAILEEQGSRAQPRPDEQAQQGPSACSLEGKSISQVHQMFADLICAEEERARDAAEKVKQQGQDDR